MKTILFFFYIITIFLFASCVPIDPPDPPEYYSKIVLMKNNLAYPIKVQAYCYKITSDEDWCKNNEVILDTQKIYHDNNGNLFNKYFEK